MTYSIFLLPSNIQLRFPLYIPCYLQTFSTTQYVKEEKYKVVVENEEEDKSGANTKTKKPKKLTVVEKY